MRLSVLRCPASDHATWYESVSCRYRAKRRRQLDDNLRVENFSMGLLMVPDEGRRRVESVQDSWRRGTGATCKWRSQGKTDLKQNEKRKN